MIICPFNAYTYISGISSEYLLYILLCCPWLRFYYQTFSYFFDGFYSQKIRIRLTDWNQLSFELIFNYCYFLTIFVFAFESNSKKPNVKNLDYYLNLKTEDSIWQTFQIDFANEKQFTGLVMHFKKSSLIAFKHKIYL